MVSRHGHVATKHSDLWGREQTKTTILMIASASFWGEFPDHSASKGSLGRAQ